MGDPSVVNEAVQPPLVGAQFVEHLLYMVVLGDIALNGICLAALASNLFDCFTGSLGVDLEHIHPSALLGESQRDSLANPGAAPGDHCVFTFQAEHARQCLRDRRARQATTLGQALLTEGEGSLTLGQAHE